MDPRIETEPDFIAIKRFNYSLEKLLQKYPDGVPDKYIAQALEIEEEQIPSVYAGIAAKLRTLMNVEV